MNNDITVVQQLRSFTIIILFENYERQTRFEKKIIMIALINIII